MICMINELIRQKKRLDIHIRSRFFEFAYKLYKAINLIYDPPNQN